MPKKPANASYSRPPTAALAENAAVINQEIPDRLPESARSALRDYLFARYNETFPALQQEMTERVTELAP